MQLQNYARVLVQNILFYNCMTGLLYSEYSVFNTVTAVPSREFLYEHTKAYYVVALCSISFMKLGYIHSTYTSQALGVLGTGNQIQFTHLTLGNCSRTSRTTVNSKTTIQRDCAPFCFNSKSKQSNHILHLLCNKDHATCFNKFPAYTLHCLCLECVSMW